MTAIVSAKPEYELRKRQAAQLSADAQAATVKRIDADIAAEVTATLKEISDPNSPRYNEYGKLIFNNPASQGAYSCARCHTKGWSYDATTTLDRNGNPMQTSYVDGNGWFGPSLRNGATLQIFNTPEAQQKFIAAGSKQGVKIGNAGVGDGQMPGFGPRKDDASGITYAPILTEAQIAAVVAYERGL
jgi:cytochrome c peroxidase